MGASDANVEVEILRYCPPGGNPVNIGVFLLDHTKGHLYWKLRCDWPSASNEFDVEYLSMLEQGFRECMEDMGGIALLRLLEDCLSNILQFGERHVIATSDPAATLERVFAENIPVKHT